MKIVFNYIRKMPMNRMIACLREHGFKVTPQRRAVLDVIAASTGHLTAAAIYERVHEEHPAIGLVTIYRTLEVLADLDLVCRIHGEEGSRSYLMRRPNGHHHHIVCSSCGAVADFTKCDIDALERRISRETGFKIQGHLLEFEGICRRCLEAAVGPQDFREGVR